MAHIDFWFDFISPYAYFAFLRIESLAANHSASLTLRPVLLAALLDHHGQLGPAEIPSKREHTFKDIVRYAALNHVPLTGPAAHPFNPITALRCALPAVSGEDQPKVVRALFEASWAGGADLGDPTQVATALTRRGLDGEGLVAQTRESSIKQALKDEVAEALRIGVFGVPSTVCDEELFFGNDRLDMVALRLQGRDPLQVDVMERLMRLPSGASRPKARRGSAG